MTPSTFSLGRDLGRDRRLPIQAIALGLVLIGGCAAAPNLGPKRDTATSSTGVALGDLDYDQNPAMAPTAELASPDLEQGGGIEPIPSDIGQPTPQLVKQASLTLVLTDIDGAIAQVQTLLQQSQGDLLSLQDRRSPEGYAQQVSLTLRVPQAELDSVLNALRSLGTVQQQTLTAEDVSSHLVDLDARLKNLRQSEAALLQIMERSGEISHVLEVARELSTVREGIERMGAQQQNLQRQVAYAQIYLTLQSPVTPVPPLRPVGETLGSTWETATQSVKAFTVSGLKLGLWLLAFSPYWVLLGAAGYGGYYLWHRRPTSPVRAEPDRS